MKRLVLFAASIVAALSVAVSCYDDSALNTRLDNLQERIVALGDLGDELASLKVLASKLEKQVLVREVEQVSEGWRVVFTDGSSLVLKNADKGPAGDKGEQGATGGRGAAGATGATPTVSVKADGGVYYWTVNGEWLLDSDGNKVRATSAQPKLKIEDSTLYISFDNGTTWTRCGATSTDLDASIFAGFEDNGKSIVITLVDGTKLEFPFEGEFVLVMDETAQHVKAGDTIKVAYSVSGATDPEVYCRAEGGFKAYLDKKSSTAGTLVVPVTANTETGRVLVFACNGDNTLLRGIEIEQEVLDPAIRMYSDPVATYASIAVNYAVENISEEETVAYGICWGTKENPTITSDNWIPSPNTRRDSLIQAIPASMLEIDQTYHVRAYFTLKGKTTYSKDYTCKLSDQPAAINLNWVAEPAAAGFPDGVKVYKTTDKLGGYNFNAWYAIADLSKVDFRINLQQGTLKTLETQYSEDAAGDKPYVLTNGGYFYKNDGVGRTIIGANAQTILYDVTGQDNQRYPAVRGILGVEKDGTPSSCWSYAAYYFSSAMPHIAGQKPFSTPDKFSWMNKVTYAPQSAISAGPMLIKDGKILPEFTKTDKGYYLNNFEMIASDIYNGKGTDTDRTAIGYTQDGKLVLFVCDGRCTESEGADLDQLAQILKGIGCVNALNLDGGGSTAMLVNGSRVNTTATRSGSENRPVSTNLGFYPKKN